MTVRSPQYTQVIVDAVSRELFLKNIGNFRLLERTHLKHKVPITGHVGTNNCSLATNRNRGKQGRSRNANSLLPMSALLFAAAKDT
jgi:hypothetical protein